MNPNPQSQEVLKSNRQFVPKAVANPVKTANGEVNGGPKLKSAGLNFYYGSNQALHDISLEILANKTTAFIGPSGCGKSTFLRTFNRMNETLRHTRIEGEVLLDGENILEMEVSQLRLRVGMVFQKSNPFPKSIFDNVAYGPRGQWSEAKIRPRRCG